MNKGFISLTVLIVALAVIVSSAVGIKIIKDEVSELKSIQENTQLGAFRPSAYTGKLLTRLAEGGSESTFNTSPNKAKDDSTLTTAKLGDFIVFTINPGAANEEKISVSAVSTSTDIATWTIINRGLSFTENVAITANKKAHAIGEVVIISNDDHYMEQQFIEKGAAQHVTGVLTFDASNLPRASSSPDYSVGDVLRFATFQQLASTTLTGAAPATETVAGIGIFSTQAELAVGTATSSFSGTTYNLFPQNIYFNATAGSTTTVVVTEADGDIAAGFIGQDQDYTWTANQTFQATTTVNGKLTASSTDITGNLTLTGQGTDFNFSLDSQAAGDILQADTTSSWTRLGVGSVGQVLKATTSLVEWGDLAFNKQNGISLGDTGTAEVTVATTTIPANRLGSDGVIRIRFSGTAKNIGGDTLTIDLKFGGVDVITEVVASSAQFYFDIQIANDGTGTQRISGVVIEATSIAQMKNGSDNTISVDTTASKDITITFTKSGTANTTRSELGSYTVEIL